MSGSVLLVEDEERLRVLFGTELEENGFSVDLAEDADQALLKLNAGRRYDVLLTDIRMPGSMDGVGLIKEAQRLAPAMPIVAMSGWVGKRESGLESVAAFLAKPFTLNRLRAEIDRVLTH